ncbi:MAG: hypothetical protein IAE67_09420, partial [Candidatus Competibacteraceae bacterium]|nr:hypothetical protein [Candidatus Competibacteraceae bacterium]
MKKIYYSFLIIFLVGLLSNQANAQCPFNNTYYTTVTPPCPGTSTATCVFGGEYVTVNVTAGNTYTFSTCGSSTFDSQLTLYNSTGTTVLGYNDDGCGLQSTITWVATYTGTVQILLDQYNCLSNTTCMNLTVSCSPPAGGGSGCNTNTILCQNSAGPFSFGNPGPAVSTCLDWYATSQFAYILVNITTSGPLNLLIDGNATTGYLDVAVFNIPTAQDPCIAIQNTANQIGCNYASSSSGCNQFGSYYGCASSVPSPNVTAGQTIMIVVEDWQNGPSSTFNLSLGPPPNAQSGPPNPAITPVGPYCVTSPAVQLTAVDMGGTWSGPGVSSTGLFNPATAGVGTHTINYTIGQPPCQANSSTTITVTATPSASISPATVSICAGQSTTLTASGGGTYLWNTGATTSAITVSPAATTTYTVTVTLPGGCTASTTRIVTVNPLPTASISPATATICAGQSTTLTASGGGTYLWSNGVTTAANTVSPGATTTYTVTVTSAAGCTATATRTVTVNPLPTPSIAG